MAKIVYKKMTKKIENFGGYSEISLWKGLIHKNRYLQKKYIAQNSKKLPGYGLFKFNKKNTKYKNKIKHGLVDKNCDKISQCSRFRNFFFVFTEGPSILIDLSIYLY